MYPSLTKYLRSPLSGAALELETTEQSESGRVISGQLVSAAKERIPVTRGVPNFVHDLPSDEGKVGALFGDFWDAHRAQYGNEDQREYYTEWARKLFMVDRLPDQEADQAMRNYVSKRQYVLDAGCGSGRLAKFHRASPDQVWFNVDFSASVYVAEEELASDKSSLSVRANVYQLPFAHNFFDLIVSNGVLHHTPRPKEAFLSLVKHLAPGGDIIIAMIRKQAPIRDFSDKFIRAHVTKLPAEQQRQFAATMADLARQLYLTKADFQVGPGLEFLGLEPGAYSLHRLIHTHIMKVFHFPGYSEGENMTHQYDWYAVEYAWPHTEEQLVEWYKEAGLTDITLWKPKSAAEKNEQIRIKGTKPR